MSFADLNPLPPGVAVLQRSLERGRLGHAYLMVGDRLAELEPLARTLAKTLNCHQPPRRAPNGVALDCCDICPACRQIANDLYADVQWLRPESKLRVIVVDQVRTLLQTIYLKPIEARYKVAVIADADRLNTQAANAFLKTLEEPPARSVLLLLTTEPSRVLETVRSRCLRLTFSGASRAVAEPAVLAWVRSFADQAAAAKGGLLARYRLLGQILKELETRREAIEKELTARSPLERFEDADPELREQWEKELAAAIEAEYRRQRAELLVGLQWWLRDVWLASQGLVEGRLSLPELAASTAAVAGRLREPMASANLQRLERTQRVLATNVQEALALEVGLLSLQL
jgi:DNA polymerase III subunit delta'